MSHSRTTMLVYGLFGALAAWLTLHELRVVLAPDVHHPLFDRGAHLGVLIVAGLLCLGAALKRRSERLAWGLIGLGVLSWSFGEVHYTLVIWGDPSPPVPSPADAGYLLFPPLALAGLVALMRGRTRDVPGTLWADGLTAALAVGAVSAALVFEAVLDVAEGGTLSVATNLAYPLADLVLLSLLVGSLASTGWRLDRTLVLLALGIATFWLADSLYLVAVANGTYEAGGWYDAGWWTGLALIAAAAWQPHRPGAPPSREAMRLVVVPLAFGAVGLVVLVYGCLEHLNALAIALAAASLVAVMARLMLTFRENVRMLRASRDEALTDHLTGLGNRRALARALDEHMPTADDANPLVLVLFDLDGFKHYNDCFGHPAGDSLLTRLGDNLARYIDGRGSAYRMGGDEFCALFRPGPEIGEYVIEGAAEALTEHGEGFQIGCSWGSIVLPREAEEPADALRIADQRMYAHKHGGRRSAGTQTKDVLMRAIAECHPELGPHADGVATLAEATARRLGLAGEEVQRVRLAAELHDVGKVAIPDTILRKPGPLDDGEWSFVRRHTLIGERILSAAPALGPVARLVRASHERWDGAGYPDGLRGQAIPLGARIVAVADAFDAMVTERAYSTAMESRAALAELRRCAGTQFDPAVVEAFCAVWELEHAAFAPIHSGRQAPAHA